MLNLYYASVDGPQYNALVVLDPEGTVYYSSLGQSTTKLKQIMLQDFKALKQKHTLKALTDISTNDEITATLAKFKLIIEDASLQQSTHIPYKIVFGTSLQRKVWDRLVKIPCGTITSYIQIAEELGMPTSSRVIGNCVGSNRISPVVPCHRVLTKQHKISGYRWGTDIKEKILRQELGLKYASILN